MIKIQRFRMYDLVAVVVMGALFFFVLFTEPQLAKARIKACSSNCTGQMKQLGTVAALYEEDNRGVRPGPQPLGSKTSLVSWDRPLAIRMGANIKIDEPLTDLTQKPRHAACKVLGDFTCPQDPRREGARIMPLVPGSLDDGMADGTGICRSYTLNLGSGNLAGQEDGIAATASAIPAEKIKVAAGTVYLIENHGYATVFGQRNIANDTTIVCTREGKMMPDIFANPMARMHGPKSSPRPKVLMYDGHVELLDQATIVANGGMVMQYNKSGGASAPVAKTRGPAK